MTIVGIAAFLIGWVYSISRFGYFLGIGLGWFPALVIAFLLDTVVTFIIGAILLKLSMREGEARTSSSVLELPKFRVSQLDVKHLAKPLGWSVLIVLLGAAVYFTGINEFSGRCERLRGKAAILQEIKESASNMGVTASDLSRLSYYDLQMKYSHDAAANSWLNTGGQLGDYYTASLAVGDEEYYLEWPKLCFD